MQSSLDAQTIFVQWAPTAVVVVLQPSPFGTPPGTVNPPQLASASQHAAKAEAAPPAAAAQLCVVVFFSTEARPSQLWAGRCQ